MTLAHDHRIPRTALLSALALSLAACSSAPMMGSMPAWSQKDLPQAVQVPDGHRVAMETTGAGTVTYECREAAPAAGGAGATAAAMPASSAPAWVFVGPDAMLSDRSGKSVGRYYGPPATWEAKDGSKVTAVQVAVAPSGAGNLPYQLAKANPAMGSGAMNGVTYIQRVALKGGVAPSMACGAGNLGQKQVVGYQADYIFWKAM